MNTINALSGVLYLFLSFDHVFPQPEMNLIEEMLTEAVKFNYRDCSN